MFGFSFTEMLFLAVLALVVIGPKQLPEVARTLGRLLNELRRTSNTFTSELREQARVKIDPIRMDDPPKKTELEKTADQSENSEHADKADKPENPGSKHT